MAKLSSEPEVISLARQLNVPKDEDPVEGIISYCLDRLQAWCKNQPNICTIQALGELVCEKLKLGVVEIDSDEQLKQFVSDRVNERDLVFAQIPATFEDAQTYAALYERKKGDLSRHRYFAVIDCRGDKAARRFFSRWHEIAHMITLHDQLEFPFHRSVLERDPIERLMDAIAAEIGFYRPLFVPIVESETKTAGALTFEVVDRIRLSFCHTASFHATMIASAKLTTLPVLCLEAGLALKKEERQRVNSAQGLLFPEPKPIPKLRALIPASNPAAKACGLVIHKNMSVPPESIVYKAWALEEVDDYELVPTAKGTEKLSIWRHTNGKTLKCIDVQIEARRFKNCVLALLSPA